MSRSAASRTRRRSPNATSAAPASSTSSTTMDTTLDPTTDTFRRPEHHESPCAQGDSEELSRAAARIEPPTHQRTKAALPDSGYTVESAALDFDLGLRPGTQPPGRSAPKISGT